MNVSYSTVRRLYSNVSPTALRQYGGYQNRLTPKDQPPLTRKVMSGAVNNVSHLKKLLKLNVIVYLIWNMPKKERLKPADKGKQPFFSRLIRGFA